MPDTWGPAAAEVKDDTPDADARGLVVRVVGGGAVGGDGAIVDGVDAGIEATVVDGATRNPLAVVITDLAGDAASIGGGTQYTEDAAAAANPIGNAVNLVRQDTPAGLVTTDGDNVAQRGTNFGAAFTQIVSSAGAFVDTFGGGTQYTEGDTDASITGNALLVEGAGDTLVPVQGTVADGVLVNLGANNDVSVASLPLPTGAATAALQLPNSHDVTVDNAAGAAAVNIQDGGNSITVDGTVAVSTLPALVAGAANIGDVDVLTVPAPLSTTGGGTQATALRVTVATDSTGRIEVIGDVAGDTAIVSGPVTVGGRASAAAPADVSADNDAVNSWMLRNGANATVITAAGALIGGDAANGLDVDITRSALPTGASTAANQTTIIGHVDGLEGLLTTIDADTGKLADNSKAATVTAHAATAVSSSNTVLLAANANRKRFIVVNAGTELVYLGFTTTNPSATSYHIALTPCTVAHDGTGGVYIDDMWTGVVEAIATGAGGTANVSEFTA